MWIGWDPPEEGWSKLNTDGSVPCPVSVGIIPSQVEEALSGIMKAPGWLVFLASWGAETTLLGYFAWSPTSMGARLASCDFGI